MAKIARQDDRTAEEKMADAVAVAKAKFSARAEALGDKNWGGIAAEAWENAFAVEVHGEYANDLERWDAALSTLDMLADMRGLG
jgi:hypothetical protein